MSEDMDHMKTLIEICHKNLKNSEDACMYLKDRGITRKCAEKYKIGFFPQNISMLKGYVDENFLIKKCILKGPYHSDFCDFNKLIIPILNEYGDAVGIVGRCLGGMDHKALGIPKYKNSSFKKSNVLFGMNLAYESILKKDRVFVVEGYLDHLAMTKNGILECVALGGTAFSKSHLLKLLRLTNNIYFIYDSDDAGQLNASRVKAKFDSEFINMSFLKGPDDIKDVDEFFCKYNKSEFFKRFKRFNP